jgi:uncharacterized protein YukE
MTWAQVSARRLARARLDVPAADATAADVVAAMCGAHAQVLSAAELGVGLRVAGATRADVRHALWTERSLVKTFGPRGTVHLLPTRNLPLWTGALAAVPPQNPNAMPEGLRITPEQTDAVVDAVGTVLADAELTVDELTAAICELVGGWAGDPVMDAFQGKWPRWRQVMHTTAHRGVLCFGPNRGRNVTYTSPRRWLPGFEPADPATALRGLVRAYLWAYGPATSQHFARWLNTTRGWAAERFASMAGELEQVDLEGTPAWVLAGDTEAPAEPPAGLRLLPYFDAYVIAGQPRELLYPGRAYQRALAGGQAGNFPVLLIDGTVAGVWHQRRSGRRLAVTVEPFGPLTAAQRRALDEQVTRVGEILEGRTELTVGIVTVGPHA